MSDGVRESLFKSVAVLLTVATIIAIPLGIFSVSVNRVLASPDTLSRTISDNLLSGGMWREQVTAELILALFPNQNQDAWFLDLDPETRLRITQIVLPDRWIEDQVQAIVTSFIVWIESDTLFKVDVVPLKNYFGPDLSHEIIEIIIDTWPACDNAQVQVIQGALQTDRLEDIPYCQPAGEMRGEYILALDHWLQRQIEIFGPDLSSAMESSLDSLAGSIRPVRSNFVTLLTFLLRLRLFPVFLLGLLMMLEIRSFRELGQWWGVPLALGAGLCVMAIFITYVLGQRGLSNTTSSTTFAEGAGIVWDLIRIILGRALIWSGVLLVVGGALVLSRLRRTPDQRETDQVEIDLGKEPSPMPGVEPPPIKPFQPTEREESSSGDSAT